MDSDPCFRIVCSAFHRSSEAFFISLSRFKAFSLSLVVWFAISGSVSYYLRWCFSLQRGIRSTGYYYVAGVISVGALWLLWCLVIMVVVAAASGDGQV
jgi:hypothetical protein